MIRNVINAAYTDFMTLNMLHNNVVDLAILKDEYKDSISAEQKLPKEYLIAILKFRELYVSSFPNGFNPDWKVSTEAQTTNFWGESLSLIFINAH